MSDTAHSNSIFGDPGGTTKRRQSVAEENWQKADTRRRWWLSLPAVLIITAFSILPIGVVIVYSFLTPGDFGNVRWIFSLDGWTNVFFERDMFDETLSPSSAHIGILWRSVSLSLITTLLTLVTGVPTAYFIATRSPHMRGIWLFLITIPFWTNMLVRTIAVQEMIRNDGLINSCLKWLGVIDQPIHMMFSDFAILLGMTYIFLPLMVLPVYSAIEKFDFGLVEAAHDLYATRLYCVRRVILPLIKPGIIAGSILVFVPSLGAYVIPRILGGGKNLMLGNLIELQFGQGRNWPLGAALSITLMIMILIAMIWYTRITSSEEKQNG